MEKPINQFCRNDGFNPSIDVSNEFQETWVHKEVVIITGKGEDDFIIGEKPVMTDRVNIQKRIQEEAKTTDLKALLTALLKQGITNPTGEEPELNKRQGFYGDISSIQKGLENNGQLPSVNEIKEKLPEELKSLSVEQLAAMSDEDIIKYIGQVRSSNEEVKPEVQPEEKGNE